MILFLVFMYIYFITDIAWISLTLFVQDEYLYFIEITSKSNLNYIEVLKGYMHTHFDRSQVSLIKF